MQRILTVSCALPLILTAKTATPPSNCLNKSPSELLREFRQSEFVVMLRKIEVSWLP